MTDAELDTIDARANAASSGPWTWADAYTLVLPDMAPVSAVQVNRAFLAHVREDVPALVRALRAAHTEIARLRALLEGDRSR